MIKIHNKEMGDICVSYDPECHAAYIRVKDGKVSKTKEDKPGIFLDFDSRNELLGIEVIDPRQITIKIIKGIAQRFGLPELGQLNPSVLPKLFATA